MIDTEYLNSDSVLTLPEFLFCPSWVKPIKQKVCNHFKTCFIRHLEHVPKTEISEYNNHSSHGSLKIHLTGKYHPL